MMAAGSVRPRLERSPQDVRRARRILKDCNMKTLKGGRSVDSFKLLAIGAAMTVSIALAALTQADATDPETRAPAQTASYLPSVSDFMIATIQPRHIRLWLAARNKNWDFAAYELGNLKGAFNRLGRAHPRSNDMSLQDMITSATEQPFVDIDKAVRSKDATEFLKAYGDLTSGCNACHQAMNHGAVVIRVPPNAFVPDQDFTQAAP
jgi:HAMP domain-containing protein